MPASHDSTTPVTARSSRSTRSANATSIPETQSRRQSSDQVTKSNASSGRQTRGIIKPSARSTRISSDRISIEESGPSHSSPRSRSILVSASPEGSRRATTGRTTTDPSSTSMSSASKRLPRTYSRAGRNTSVYEGEAPISTGEIAQDMLSASTSALSTPPAHSRRSSRSERGSPSSSGKLVSNLSSITTSQSSKLARRVPDRDRTVSSDFLNLKGPSPETKLKPKDRSKLASSTKQRITNPKTPLTKKPRLSRLGSELDQTATSSTTPPAKNRTPKLQPVAGPSRSVPERRVLPARIRRTAGRGADGVRDLEDMVCDWLERYGEPLASPPESLPIYITSLSLDLVRPPTTQSHSSNPIPPSITLTPTRAKLPASPLIPFHSPTKGAQEKIETPTWTMVSRGGDDEDEAREELSVGYASPTKRLRHAELLEDTSDAYYQSVHRKYEAFERRQKAREKEKLVFERYKMRARVEQLRNLSAYAWAAVISNVLSRYGGQTCAKSRQKLADKGPEWLRAQLVKEGKDVLKRYDQLLPSDQRKSKLGTTPTPTMTPGPSVSPPPLMVPDRVAVLRESSRGTKRQSLDAGKPARSSLPGRRVSEPPAKAPKRSENDSPNGHRRDLRPKRNLVVPNIPGLDEDIWVVSHPEKAPAVSREEALEMREVESEWL
ncbi:hypothetical protein BD324DRAFT_387251 [Kockovaella imperatae]|uniref:Something about silencing protein 4 domain-containing protein n=1 Tax=Kockovaella imperatae TaxID=4999 RepID=A0A1Y1UKF5_9TREE|nr:hypothetical protein BD324DRAFT_387251 [Kockovaella imperatae]ORX37605.1 hypothetical protein BD324DRAFT_387251 [Kockovaella imperatae]